MPDDTQGIPGPDADQLKQMISQDQPKDEPQDKEPKKDDGLDLGQFKNPKDMLKSYKEIQGAFTRTTQENKDLKEKLQELEELKEQMRYQPSYQGQPQQQAPQTPEDFDSMLAEDPRKAIESIYTSNYQKMRIAEVLEEMQYDDQKNFHNRYAYAQRLSQNPQYAHLANSPVGVRKLFSLGDELMEKEQKANASKQLEAILGGPVDEQKIAKLREMLGTGQNKQQQSQTQLGDVYMPDTSDTYRPDVDAEVDKRKELERK